MAKYNHQPALLLIAVLSALFCGISQSQRCLGRRLFICVTNDADKTCEHVSDYTERLTGVSQILRSSRQSRCVTVYFTNGKHSLESDIFFANQYMNIEMAGQIDLQTSIECNGHGLLFMYSTSVLVQNVEFNRCSTLYCRNGNLNFENVTIRNSVGGIRAENCPRVVISNCSFANNTSGHVSLSSQLDRYTAQSGSNVNLLVQIVNSLFYHSRNSSGLELVRSVDADASCIVQLINSTFQNNARGHVYIQENFAGSGSGDDEMRVTISRCVFSDSLVGIYIFQRGGSAMNQNFLKVDIFDSIISNHSFRGMSISNANELTIDRCKLLSNSGIGLVITKSFACFSPRDKAPELSDIEFMNNKRALEIAITFCDLRRNWNAEYSKQVILIENCTFDENVVGTNASSVVHVYDSQYAKYGSGRNYTHDDIIVYIQNSQFTNSRAAVKNNSNTDVDCSVISTFFVSIVASNVSFVNNSCTGIILNSTTLKIENTLYFVRNYASLGGALRMLEERSAIMFSPNASLHCIHNRATKYGGAIYSGETCREQMKKCFFQLELAETSLPIFHFTSNRADKGGNIFFGGCLSGCLLNSGELMNLNQAENTFWKLASLSLQDDSQSNFAEHPSQVVFCTNSSNPSRPVCHNYHQVAIFRGGTFSVNLMAIGGLCAPSFNIIHASVAERLRKGVEVRQGGSYQQANPYCEKHTYSLRGGYEQTIFDDNFTVDVVLDLQEKSQNNLPTRLAVNYINRCPSGFELNEKDDLCRCSTFLQSMGVECIDSNYSLSIPARIWVGMWEHEVAVGSSCQYCKASGVHNIEGVSASDGVCAEKRSSTLCGKCITGHSIKLGGYQCGDCLKSSYQGYVLTIAFALVGLVLIVALLKLNLTVSTGLLNGLIFYSNIVYSNHNVFLPLDRDTNSGRLNVAVQFLFIFNAWINLDFGFDTCYFHGTDTYVVTWLQFIFPIYIWLLIFLIVIFSRYSTRVSKFTGHNTISVLATLLLLSYTKLLLAVLSALSYTQLQLDDSRTSSLLWFSDASVMYASGKHLWLLLMSVFMILAYTLPFTSLVTLGPYLMSKSRYKVLRWIHKVRPFLDAFYGPYTRTYYYWPGILLILRVILSCIIAFYSIGDGSFILVTIVVFLVLLLFLYLLMGKTDQVSLHRNKKLNLLELFFVLNLILFSVISLYLILKYPKNLVKRQILAMVMAGSVFTLFCCILVYHVYCTVRSWRITSKIIAAIHSRKKVSERVTQQEPLDDNSIGTYYENRGSKKPATQTDLEMAHKMKPNELREPLLESNNSTS